MLFSKIIFLGLNFWACCVRGATPISSDSSLDERIANVLKLIQKAIEIQNGSPQTQSTINLALKELNGLLGPIVERAERELDPVLKTREKQPDHVVKDDSKSADINNLADKILRLYDARSVQQKFKDLPKAVFHHLLERSNWNLFCCWCGSENISWKKITIVLADCYKDVALRTIEGICKVPITAKNFATVEQAVYLKGAAKKASLYDSGGPLGAISILPKSLSKETYERIKTECPFSVFDTLFVSEQTTAEFLLKKYGISEGEWMALREKSGVRLEHRIPSSQVGDNQIALARAEGEHSGNKDGPKALELKNGSKALELKNGSKELELKDGSEALELKDGLANEADAQHHQGQAVEMPSLLGNKIPERNYTGDYNDLADMFIDYESSTPFRHPDDY